MVKGFHQQIRLGSKEESGMPKFAYPPKSANYMSQIFYIVKHVFEMVHLFTTGQCYWMSMHTRLHPMLEVRKNMLLTVPVEASEDLASSGRHSTRQSA